METIVTLVINHPILSISCTIGGLLLIVAFYDIFQKKHAIVHNFPVIGRLRYLLEEIGPELRQYWVANDKEEMPFNRAERRWIYATSKRENNNFGFGTSELIYSVGYPILKHSGFPFPDKKATYLEPEKSGIPCLKILGEYNNRQKAFRPTSVINISAMSFGSLGKHAISALNKGAKKANCLHNTGEGSISPYHQNGGALIWQLGTGYFGARDPNGEFSLEKLIERLDKNPTVKAIEIKLSQGAKPGKGGILPGEKVTKEISEIRGIPEGKDCYSPNNHSAFSTVKELIDFIEKIATETGLPVGIKSAIGREHFWKELAEEINQQNRGPDFITIDGGEGGTGAAPLTFADHVSLPFKVGFARVYKIFCDYKLTDRIVWVGSAKLGFPDRAIVAFAMGCDLINIAREAMIAIGCIQAQKCHSDNCPTGVATQNKWLQAGLDVTDKSERFSNYIKGLRKELIQLSHAAGYEHPGQFTLQDIEFSNGVNHFITLEEMLPYQKIIPPFTSMKNLS